MAQFNGQGEWLGGAGKILMALVLAGGLAIPPLRAQSGNNQNSTPAASNQSADDIPDAPSAVQPPPKPEPPAPKPESGTSSSSFSKPKLAPNYNDYGQQQPPPPMPPVETLPPGTAIQSAPSAPRGGRNLINPAEDLYKIQVTTNFVQVPVLVKDSDGRRVDGLLPKDFTVLENGVKQQLTYFTSDPFELSVAIVIDVGMSDDSVQKINETYSALVGALSPYDEAALYTYSSTVSQVTDYSQKPELLTAAFNQLKTVRGRNNGPAVLTGPMATNGPIINGAPAGGPLIEPVNTPPREAHVLNDAILRAAFDLRKRDPLRRKMILVVSDGRELGSQASYRDVMRVLQSRNVQVKAVAVGTGSLPVYRQVEKIHHLLWQGYADILPKYCYASGGGDVLHELTRNAIENAYAEATSEARNQYTLGYSPKATTGSAACRNIEVQVDRRGLKVFAKSGYCPAPPR
jgi:VWFA-related protein